MSRFWDLASDLTKIVNEYNDMEREMHMGNPLHRCRRLEEIVGGLFWLNAQILKELATRDGADTTLPPKTIEVVGAVPE